MNCSAPQNLLQSVLTTTKGSARIHAPGLRLSSGTLSAGANIGVKRSAQVCVASNREGWQGEKTETKAIVLFLRLTGL